MKKVILIIAIVYAGIVKVQAQSSYSGSNGAGTLQPSTLSNQYSQQMTPATDFRASSGNQEDTINDYINRRTQEMLNNNNISNPNNPASPDYNKFQGAPVNSATPENQYTPLGGGNGNQNNSNIYRP